MTGIAPLGTYFCPFYMVDKRAEKAKLSSGYFYPFLND